MFPASSSFQSDLTRIYAWFSALASRDFSAMEALLSEGVDVDTPHPLRHSTGLMEMVHRGCVERTHWLLARGASPLQLCGMPLGTPLHCALQMRYWPLVALLLAHSPSTALLDGYGRFPLHVLALQAEDAPWEDVLAIGTQLIAKGCPLDAMDAEGITALHYAVIADHLGLTELLLIHGANPNVRSPETWVSPLMIAALERNAPMLKLLLDHGADPHQPTREGSTPLSIYPTLTRSALHRDPLAKKVESR